MYIIMYIVYCIYIYIYLFIYIRINYYVSNKMSFNSDKLEYFTTPIGRIYRLLYQWKEIMGYKEEI